LLELQEAPTLLLLLVPQSWRQELFQLLEQSWRQELFQLLEQLLLHPYCLAVFPLPAQVRQVLWFT
jgi:hypothetical protein